MADSEFNQKVKLISIDRLGYGSSDLGNAELSLAINADAVKTIITQYQPSQVYVIGHSCGGHIVA